MFDLNLPKEPHEIVFPWDELELPAYRAGRHRNWTCERVPAFAKLSPGYFRLHRYQPPGWMIKRKNVIWMSLTAMEQESHMPHVAVATGHVVVAGLGMGMVTYNLARKPEVLSVTVVEKDPSVVALMDKISDWRSWPKVTLVRGDALDFVPSGPVDFLYADIWEHLSADESLPLTQAIQRNVQAKRVGFWGQELEYFTWCIRNKLTLDQTLLNRTFRDYVAFTKLPLIGAEWPRYARLCAGASVLQTAASPEINKDKNKQFAVFNHYCQIMGVSHG
jgi:hypothetical protein